MNVTCIAVRVEAEYDALEWWESLRHRYPEFARSLERHGAAVIAEPLWGDLAAIPGFSGGPDYAPTALMDCGGEGEMWADVVGGSHGVFDSLS